MDGIGNEVGATWFKMSSVLEEDAELILLVLDQN
jgi:hypothetical protein